MGGLTGRKNFLKIFEKRGGKPKIGVRERSGGGAGAPYIGCAGRFLSLNAKPLAALLEVHFVHAPQLQAPTRDPGDSLLLYIEGLLTSAIARSLEVSPLVRPVIL